MVFKKLGKNETAVKTTRLRTTTFEITKLKKSYNFLNTCLDAVLTYSVFNKIFHQMLIEQKKYNFSILIRQSRF